MAGVARVYRVAGVGRWMRVARVGIVASEWWVWLERSLEWQE